MVIGENLNQLVKLFEEFIFIKVKRINKKCQVSLSSIYRTDQAEEKYFEPIQMGFKIRNTRLIKTDTQTNHLMQRSYNSFHQFFPTIQITSLSRFTFPCESAYCQTTSVIESHVRFFTSSVWFANIACMDAGTCWWNLV